VVIPSVNDGHLKEVSRLVRAKGAFLHNLMPLIAEARHGTFYGITGQRDPSPAELQALQDECAGEMRLMRHCRQCRADAIGRLGEDRGGEEFTLDKIGEREIDYEQAMERRRQVQAAIEAKRQARRERAGETYITPAQIRGSAKGQGCPVLLAVATRGQGLINEDFNQAREFLIYEASPRGVRLVGHRKVDRSCSADAAAALQQGILALQGCAAVLCSKIGYQPRGLLEEAGTLPNGEHAMEPIEVAVAAVYRELAAAGSLATIAPRASA
jgi:nitrogen fixation protein NifB